MKPNSMKSQVNTCCIISNCLPEKTIDETIEFDTKKTLEMLNLLVNLSCKSASLPPLCVAQKNGELRKERSQINIFIQTPFGEFKSTIFRLAAEHYPSIILTDVTFPKLVGSYDVQSRRIVPSACWEYRNKTIILDEFHFRGGIINALLSLIESGEYNARARSSSQKPNKINNKKRR